MIAMVICILIGGVCAILGFCGIAIFIAEKRKGEEDWHDLALGLFFSLIAAICYYAAYMGWVAA